MKATVAPEEESRPPERASDKSMMETQNLIVEYVRPDSLTGLTEAENPRRHSEADILALCKSISKFGQRKPLVVWRGKVIAGNGMLVAMKRLKFEKVAIVRADHLSENDAKAYAIADNRIAELSRWNDEVLRELLRELIEAEPLGKMDFVGFDERDLEALLGPPASTEIASSELGQELPPETSMRLVTLFFDLAEFTEFQNLIAVAQAAMKTDSTSDTVLAALRKVSTP